ncbi:MAG: polysaccharide deacetylase family protein [Bacillota bacterium]
MRFYVFKVNNLFKYTFIMLLTAVLATVFVYSKEEVMTVFQPKRNLPIYSVDYPDDKIALTFDCAWGSDDIPHILNTLKEHDVRATFFIVGLWAKKYPDAVKMISNGGHDIANHSYSHLRMGCIDNNRIRSEILKCGEVLKDITSKDVDLFRAPYGDYNNNVIRIARELNHYSIQWDVDSLDWKPGITPEQIQNRVLKNVKRGSIVLFHNDTSYTAKILPDLITALKNKGYGFIPVSEMIMRDSYDIDHTGRQKKKQ